MSTNLQVAALVPCTEAEGPYQRFALWTRGCALRCPGCCNPEFFEPGIGAPTALGELLEHIDAACQQHDIEGITILGGEPLEQLGPVTALARSAKARGLGVIVFTGYTLEEARDLAGFDALWTVIDTLVDGRFDARNLDRQRRFIGSTNQTLHHRTRRYRDESLWRGAPAVEARIASDGTLSLHGNPHEVQRLLRLVRHEPTTRVHDDITTR